MRVSRSQMTSLHPLARAVAALTLACGLAGGALAVQAAPTPQAAAPSREALEIQRLIKNGQSTQALKLIDDALAKNPADPAMRFRRGVTLSMLDRKAEAVQVFEKLVQDHPDMPAPYNNLAVLYGSQGDYDKARAALVAAIRTNPQYATAYQNLGDVYAQLASQAYSKALQLDKADTSVPPKLVLLRELDRHAGPAWRRTGARGGRRGRNQARTAARADAGRRNVRPIQVAVATPPPLPVVAPRPAFAPAPAPVVVAMAAPKPAPVPPPAAVVVPKPPVAVAGPVAIAKPVPAPTPAPAPAAAPAVAAGNGITEVDAAVHAWASAWSRRDILGYLGAYTPDYATGGKSHRAWEEDRKARILPRKRIAVEISDLRVSVNGDKAQAHFKQTYESDTLTTSGHKTLDLVRTPSGKWLIKQESVGG